MQFRPNKHDLFYQRFTTADFSGVTLPPGFIAFHPGLLRFRTFGAL